MRGGVSIKKLFSSLLAAAMLFGAEAYAADLARQSSESDGVTIAVKPLELTATAATWAFEVSLDARSQDLGDDLLRTAFVLDRAAKKQIAPTAWKGDAPGGRHRKGVLSFNAVVPMPKAVELRIQRVGETAPRVFRWDLDCPCNDPKMHSS